MSQNFILFCDWVIVHWIDILCFIYLESVVLFSFFWLLGMMLLWTIMYTVFGYMFSFLLSIYIGMIFLGNVLTLMFNILRNCHTVFLWQLYHFTPHQQCVKALLSPYPGQHFILSAFEYRHSTGYEVVSHCGHSRLLSFYQEFYWS